MNRLEQTVNGIFDVLLWSTIGEIDQQETHLLFREWMKAVHYNTHNCDPLTVVSCQFLSEENTFNLICQAKLKHPNIDIESQIIQMLSIFKTQFNKQLEGVTSGWINYVEDVFEFLDEGNTGLLDPSQLQFLLVAIIMGNLRGHEQVDSLCKVIQEKTSVLVDNLRCKQTGITTLSQLKTYLIREGITKENDVHMIRQNLKSISLAWGLIVSGSGSQGKKNSSETLILDQPVNKNQCFRFPQVLLSSSFLSIFPSMKSYETDQNFNKFLHSATFKQIIDIQTGSHLAKQCNLAAKIGGKLLCPRLSASLVVHIIRSFYRIGTQLQALDGSMILKESKKALATGLKEDFVKREFENLGCSMNTCSVCGFSSQEKENNYALPTESDIYYVFLNLTQQYQQVSKTIMRELIFSLQSQLVLKKASNQTPIDSESISSRATARAESRNSLMESIKHSTPHNHSQFFISDKISSNQPIKIRSSAQFTDTNPEIPEPQMSARQNFSNDDELRRSVSSQIQTQRQQPQQECSKRKVSIKLNELLSQATEVIACQKESRRFNENSQLASQDSFVTQIPGVVDLNEISCIERKNSNVSTQRSSVNQSLVQQSMPKLNLSELPGESRINQMSCLSLNNNSRRQGITPQPSNRYPINNQEGKFYIIPQPLKAQKNQKDRILCPQNVQNRKSSPFQNQQSIISKSQIRQPPWCSSRNLYSNGTQSSTSIKKAAKYGTLTPNKNMKQQPIMMKNGNSISVSNIENINGSFTTRAPAPIASRSPLRESFSGLNNGRTQQTVASSRVMNRNKSTTKVEEYEDVLQRLSSGKPINR